MSATRDGEVSNFYLLAFLVLLCVLIFDGIMQARLNRDLIRRIAQLESERR